MLFFCPDRLRTGTRVKNLSNFFYLFGDGQRGIKGVNAWRQQTQQKMWISTG
jgi:hypothetical protein